MEVVWRPTALVTFYDAVNYTEEHFGPRTAQRFAKRIKSYEALLAAHPYLGPIEPCLSHLPTPYRSLVVHRHYKLIYCVDEAGEEVTIIALWDTRRNPLRMPQDV